ncbi:hypothetical protein CPBF426_22700 [Xanthomonas arboricola pv. juglandis]|jgi:hypothetical protein|uniref:DUF4177 domain-containing protein n=1 Tax=Xanthomonas euroxanthea TaxID=2259622 RepID=A0A8E4G4H7_9XANT|nr:MULTISPECIES: DUF4177 domain-containing protein [Xanthomonas]PPT32931.1 hypothetical protein XaCFBP7622_03845 [Xanthomonas arboricola]SYZ54141.1 hypothetical protein CPBF426_22700 [Xanthomonas arboricola pv. juglandis]MBB3812074.1 hypothetical protein [Xanthomonas euroxanthea]NIJ94367.1 hypothetical protein [Xanthomonas euroxanthea]PPT35527.1 hypothetical protein XarjCFBP7653_18515 [Xanthomonas arboricola]
MSKRWNYLTIELKPSFIGTIKREDIQAELVKQGSLGWELVNVLMQTPLSAALLVFKKEL